MADIKLLISIPEETYEYWKEHKHEYVLAEAIANGIPLPKGHGRLSDVDWVLNKMDTTDAQPITPNEHYAWDFAQTLFRNAPTIIEADKAESEDNNAEHTYLGRGVKIYKEEIEDIY